MTTQRQNELRDNYLRVLEKIEAARMRRGTGEPVTLLAASKTMPAEDIAFLARECGLKVCGENFAQEFRDKFDTVSETGCRMDFIGHLQSNKIKYVAGKAGLIHSLDSVRLASEIDEKCGKLGVVQDVLVEVNIGEEESKTGISSCEMAEFLERISGFEHLNVRGMMTMAPKCTEIEDFRRYFRKSYEIFLDFFAKKSHNIGEPVLSMGMSDSYECAIEEGATIVRVGSSIFGSRVYH
ncbi:MAG: YggS family pyridoxal phosphate-dependent enzyme [Clostridia bacterium]|nr:YggS family pyridoxal phosphate-dependent enzyme [Clostridia bacterium]MBQ7931804.1 YggS family pyridoxal phosphate-dependent enzyme [Clostridia bacterium]